MERDGEAMLRVLVRMHIGSSPGPAHRSVPCQPTGLGEESMCSWCASPNCGVAPGPAMPTARRLSDEPGLWLCRALRRTDEDPSDQTGRTQSVEVPPGRGGWRSPTSEPPAMLRRELKPDATVATGESAPQISPSNARPSIQSERHARVGHGGLGTGDGLSHPSSPQSPPDLWHGSMQAEETRGGGKSIAEDATREQGIARAARLGQRQPKRAA